MCTYIIVLRVKTIILLYDTLAIVQLIQVYGQKNTTSVYTAIRDTSHTPNVFVVQILHNVFITNY